MPSLKSHIVALYLRHTRKKAFASPQSLNGWIARARRTQDHRPPAALSATLDISQSELGGHPVYAVVPKAPLAGRHIVYLHGGAFCFEMTSYHWSLVAEMSERLGATVTVPIYPLAPEARFDAIFGFAMQVYRSVLDRTPARSLVLMGDSAGGNMAVVLTMMAAREGLPLPARHVLISPGLDMRLENPEVAAMEAADPWLGIPGGLEAIRLYAGDMDRYDWRISPVLGDLSVLPPTLILAGSRDMLTPDTVRFAEAAGPKVEIDVAPGMIHVWPLIDMPEARMARNRIVTWLEDGWRETETG